MKGRRSLRSTSDEDVNVLHLTRLIHIHPLIIVILLMKSATKREGETTAPTIVIADDGREREGVRNHRGNRKTDSTADPSLSQTPFVMIRLQTSISTLDEFCGHSTTSAQHLSSIANKKQSCPTQILPTLQIFLSDVYTHPAFPTPKLQYPSPIH